MSTIAVDVRSYAWLLRWFGPRRWLGWLGARSAVDSEGGVSEDPWGYAVRRDWPDGTHDLYAFTVQRERADQQLNRDRGYWRPGLMRPTAMWVVRVSPAHLQGHKQDGCRNGRCPIAPAGQR